MFLMLSADFFKISFFKNSFRPTIRVSNSLDPDQDGHSVGPLDPDQDRHRSLSGSKLFVKVVSRQQRLLPARKELI